MRVLGKVVLTTVGVLLLLVGAAAAWVVGPDDTVVAGETEFTTGTAYTPAGLFDVENLDVVVTAEADEGEVFVGVGHPVDVTDVVAGHSAYRIYQVHVGSLAGSVDDGEDPVPDPRGIDWFDTVEGAGEQSLSYPIDGMSPQFLVHSPSGAPVTASIGFTVAGTFALVLVIAGVGLLLLVGGILLPRRRRDPNEPPEDVSIDAEGADGGGADRRDEASSSEEPSRPRAADGVTRRVAALLGAGALVLPLSACAVVPEIPAQMADTEVTKVALTADRLDELWADYDKRNNAAIKAAAAPKFDPTAWQKADTGVALEGDLYWTRYKEAASEAGDKVKGKAHRLTTTGDWLSSPAFDAYPMWAVVHGEMVSSDEEKEKEKDGKDEKPKFTFPSLMVKEAADAPWKLRSSFSVPLEEVANFPEVTTAPTDAQVAKATKVAEAMNVYVSTGKKSKLLGDLTGIKALRQHYLESLEEEAADDDSPTTWSLDSELFDDESVHVLPADGAVYAVIDQRHTLKLQHADSSWHWNPPADAVNGDAGSLLYRQEASTVLVRIPDEGKAQTFPYYTRSVIADSM